MNINLDDIAIVHNANNDCITQIKDENNNIIWQIKRPKLSYPVYSQIKFNNEQVTRWLSLQDYTCHWDYLKNISLYAGTNFSNYLWTDGTDIYYSNNGTSYLYNKNNKTFNEITFNIPIIGADYIWTDGNDIFYSYGGTQKIYDKENRTWLNNTFTGTFTQPYGNLIWTDGTSIYYDLDKTYNPATKEFSTINLNGGSLIFDFHPIHTWRNLRGDTIFTRSYYDENDQFIQECYSFKFRWDGIGYWTDYTSALNKPINGSDVWTDGRNIYCSGTYEGGACYKLNDNTNFTSWSDYTEWNCDTPPSETPSTYAPNNVWTEDIANFRKCTTKTFTLLN